MRVRIFSVDDVQVDVLKSKPASLKVTASGKVRTRGWTSPELAPWIYIAPPSDGIVDLDFTAESPQGAAGDAMTDIQAELTFVAPGWVKGVRVHATQNEKEAELKSPLQLTGDEDPFPLAFPTGGGDSVPWPWVIPQK